MVIFLSHKIMLITKKLANRDAKSVSWYAIIFAVRKIISCKHFQCSIFVEFVIAQMIFDPSKHFDLNMWKTCRVIRRFHQYRSDEPSLPKSTMALPRTSLWTNFSFDAPEAGLAKNVMVCELLAMLVLRNMVKSKQSHFGTISIQRNVFLRKEKYCCIQCIASRGEVDFFHSMLEYQTTNHWMHNLP